MEFDDLNVLTWIFVGIEERHGAFVNDVEFVVPKNSVICYATIKNQTKKKS